MPKYARVSARKREIHAKEKYLTSSCFKQIFRVTNAKHGERKVMITFERNRIFTFPLKWWIKKGLGNETCLKYLRFFEFLSQKL